MDESRTKKIRFRAWRRGFREADLILGPFADHHVHRLSSGQLDDLELLLDQPDQDLYAWIVGLEPATEPFDGEVLDLIKSFRFSARAGRAARADLGA